MNAFQCDLCKAFKTSHQDQYAFALTQVFSDDPVLTKDKDVCVDCAKVILECIATLGEKKGANPVRRIEHQVKVACEPFIMRVWGNCTDHEGVNRERRTLQDAIQKLLDEDRAKPALLRDLIEQVQKDAATELEALQGEVATLNQNLECTGRVVLARDSTIATLRTQNEALQMKLHALNCAGPTLALFQDNRELRAQKQTLREALKRIRTLSSGVTTAAQGVQIFNLADEAIAQSQEGRL